MLFGFFGFFLFVFFPSHFENVFVKINARTDVPLAPCDQIPSVVVLISLSEPPLPPHSLLARWRTQQKTYPPAGHKSKKTHRH